ncbi:MAG: peptidoglycan editing factor PgeF [Alphaproteobacteria bacterium]|nr:peptidoglycan editing factor PgeF [Alphaproteobacteria bacterium]
MIRLPGLDEIGAIRHAFFTRQGGVSDGFYASLNCGYRSGDDPQRVEQNRTIAMRLLGAASERLVTCHQIHSAVAVTVDEPWPNHGAAAADAMATRRPGLVLGVLAADCAPLLLCDPAARVIGTAHAGWRGAFAGVAEAAVEAMERLGAERYRIRVGIGPCIGSASYEVGPEFPQSIISRDPSASKYFASGRRTGHFMFDLPGYVAHRLCRFGVPFVERASHDTAAEPDLFFSYRRSRLCGEPGFGLGLSAIVIDG